MRATLPVRLIPTASQTVGPFFPGHFAGEGDHDLTFVDDRERRAQGERIYIAGRVFEANRVPRSNALVEIWQADAGGRFDHPNDPHAARADPNFMGWGRRCTEEDGCYDFITVKPGAYRDPVTGLARAPHINLSLMGSGLMRRVVTTLFFPGEAGNSTDPVLAAIRDPPVRERLILRRAQLERAPADTTAYALDIVLQGEDETPFFAD